MHGTNNGFPSRPDVFVPPISILVEQITKVVGSASGNSITSIGFRTSRGTTYGPWGVGGGEPFEIDGLLVGLFGALEDGEISGIGVWYTPTVTFTPGINPFPMFLEMSPAVGDLTNVWTWDDTPDMSGAHIPHHLHSKWLEKL
jgi:hypothetical protein